MMGRNHIITGGLALGWAGSVAAASGLAVWHHPEALVMGSQLFLWGTTAPDLDAEAAVASSTWAPQRHAAGARRERLLPEARGVVATLTPGAHWLSAAMRIVARRHYLATRGPGDPITDDDPHRKLWHTAAGAAVMATVVCLLLSEAPLDVVSAWWPQVMDARLGDGRWWAPWVFAAPWVGFMTGVVFRGYFGQHLGDGRRRKGRGKPMTSRAAGWFTGVATCLVCGATGALASSWPLWWGAVVAGCAVHVAGDKCSRHGCAWWAPFLSHADTGRRWAPSHLVPRSATFRTGYGGEALFVLGLIVLSVVGWWALWSWSIIPMGRGNLWWWLTG